MRAVTMSVEDIIHSLSEILYDISTSKNKLNMNDEIKIVRGGFFGFEKENDEFVLTIPSITSDDLKD